MRSVVKVLVVLGLATTACQDNAEQSVASEKSGTEQQVVGDFELKQPTKEAVVELMKRWNVAAKSTSENEYFIWKNYDYFPHPTYAGGDKPEYIEFAKILHALLKSKENRDFIMKSNLRQLPLHYHLANQLSSFGTFIDLSFSISMSNYILSDEPELLGQLRGYCDLLDRLN